MTVDILQWLIDTSCMFLVSWTLIIACLGIYVLWTPANDIEPRAQN